MRENINQVLDSGRISYGPFCRELEQRFAEIHERKIGVLSNSGTSSLQVALQALKEVHAWSDGDEVIVPALTFVATVNIVLHNGLKPVLVDIEPNTYGIDTNKLEEAITERTRAIIPVHLFGQSCGITEVMEIAERYGLKVIEDSCECMFVRHGNKMVGSYGDIACFSTYIAHLLTTGVGGLAITNNPEYGAVMRSLVNHGRDGIYISIDDDQDVTNLEEVISRRFRFERLGHSYRITEFEAAIGVAQLDDWQDMIAKRQTNADTLNRLLEPIEKLGLIHLPYAVNEHAYMMYPLVLSPGIPKEALTLYLEEHGIETRDMVPLTNQPVYAELFNEDDYPVAKWVNESGFYVGCHQDLTDEDVVHIANTILSYFADA